VTFQSEKTCSWNTPQQPVPADIAGAPPLNRNVSITKQLVTLSTSYHADSM